jgi:hypothetical protein
LGLGGLTGLSASAIISAYSDSHASHDRLAGRNGVAAHRYAPPLTNVILGNIANSSAIPTRAVLSDFDHGTMGWTCMFGTEHCNRRNKKLADAIFAYAANPFD